MENNRNTAANYDVIIKKNQFEINNTPLIEDDTFYYIRNETAGKMLYNLTGRSLKKRFGNFTHWEDFINEFPLSINGNRYGIYAWNNDINNLERKWTQYSQSENEDSGAANGLNDETDEYTAVTYPQPIQDEPKKAYNSNKRNRVRETFHTRTLADLAQQNTSTLADELKGQREMYADIIRARDAQIQALNENMDAIQTEADERVQTVYTRIENLEKQKTQEIAEIRREYEQTIANLNAELRSKTEEIYREQTRVRELEADLKATKWMTEQEKKFESQMRKVEEANSGGLMSDLASLIPLAQGLMSNSGGAPPFAGSPATPMQNQVPPNYGAKPPIPPRAVQRPQRAYPQPVQQAPQTEKIEFENDVEIV